MGKNRSQRREVMGATLNCFSAETGLGWKVIRQVSVDYALTMIALKKWREIWYEAEPGRDRQLAGVQPLHPAERKTLCEVLLDRLCAVTITNPELKRNAGLYGRSHTLGTAEWERLKRHVWKRGAAPEAGEKPVYYDTGKIADPEDAIERAVEKVRLWPYPASAIGTDKDGKPVFGDKAVRVYPKTGIMDRGSATRKAEA